MTDLASLSSAILMGILLGGLYSLIALGLSLVFGLMRLINVAHGDLVMFASYFAYALLTAWSLDPMISIFIGIPLWLLLGYGIQKFLMSRAFKISAESPLIIAFGISLVLQNLAQIIWSPMSRSITTSYSLESFNLGSVVLPYTYVFDFIAALIVMLFLREFLKRTYLGKAISASSQDRKAAELMGINTGRIYAITFAIAAATAAIAGVFLGLTFPFTPQSGVSFLIIAFGVTIIGGLGSMFGTFLGGIILGLAQTLGAYFFGSALQMLFAYLIVILVLAIRPQGVFGR